MFCKNENFESNNLVITNLLDCTVDTPILAMSLDWWLPREIKHFYTYLFS